MIDLSLRIIAPVSLTSVCSKVLEHIIHSSIMNHFDVHSILTDKQHGFRRKHSTESQLILTVNDLTKSLNNKKQVDLVIMDFSKAFDVVPHKRLLLKLKQYGIHNKTYRWISNFLQCRAQRVVVGGEHSSWAEVDSGVPQGTVLGPLLFLAYINDLPFNVNSSVRLFADDCVLYREINSDADHLALQEDLNTLVSWQKIWQMSFNAKKCFVMRLTHARKVKTYSYKLQDSILQETKSHTYLGVTLTSNLSWNEHINQIAATASRTLAFVMRNLHHCPQGVKESAYKTLVRPLLEYSSSVWDPHTVNSINTLESVQRRAARFCLNDFTSRSPGAVTNMMKKLGWQSLATRRRTRRLIIFYKAINGHLSIPISNLTSPVKRPSRHTNTRARITLAAIKDCYKFSYLPRTIREWNNLPEAIVNINDNEKFQAAVKAHLAAMQD